MTLKDDLRHEKNMSATWEKLAHANKERAEKMEQRAEAAEAERDAERKERESLYPVLDEKSRVINELRAELEQAQHAIGVLSNTVVAQDATIKQLEQAREDVTEYRAEIARLTRKAENTPKHIQ